MAIIARDRDAIIAQDEVDEFAMVYEALRRPTDRQHFSASAYGRVVAFDCHMESHAVSTGSWLIVAGLPQSQLAAQSPTLDELEGQFAWISYDSDCDEVSVASDPFGMFTLYVAEREDKAYFATSALVLAKHLRSTPSRRGIEVFLRSGYHFGTLTNWEGIERVNPASHIIFAQNAKPRVDTYWRPQSDLTVRRMGLEQAARHCEEVNCDVYSRLLTGRDGMWADLSGGFDTRMLTLLLRKAGVTFRTNTGGDDSSTEVRIARRVAHLAGWDWSQVKLPLNWGDLIAPLISTTTAWSDGNLDVLQLARVLWGHREKSDRGRYLLIGGGGEHYRNFAWQQEFRNAGRSTRVNMTNWVDMRLLHPMDLSVFAQDPTRDVHHDLSKRMAEWASPYASEPNTAQLDIMYAYKVTGHFGAYLSAAGAFLQPQLPFYFRPGFSAVFSTSDRLRANHKLMRHMISSLDQRIASVETANGGPAEPIGVENFYRFAPYYGRIAKRAASKLTQKATGGKLFESKSVPDDRIVSARRTVVEHLAPDGGLNASEMRSARLFKPKVLESLLTESTRPDFTRDELLGRILTVELALRAVDASLDE